MKYEPLHECVLGSKKLVTGLTAEQPPTNLFKLEGQLIFIQDKSDYMEAVSKTVRFFTFIQDLKEQFTQWFLQI